MLDALADDLDSPIDVTPRLSIFPEFHHLLVPNSLQLITFQNRSFSLSTWPIRHLSIQPSPIILNFICDQIITEIANSIIFGIAREEGIHDEEYISPVIDKLLREFQFWNKVVPGQILDRKSKFVQVSQFNGATGELASLEDSMGLETIIYQQVQKSTDLISQDSYYQHEQVQTLQDDATIIEGQDNFKIQPLSILQTPSKVVSNIKTPKSRGRPKGSKTKTEIVAGIQTTLDSSFIVSKRSTRRT